MKENSSMNNFFRIPRLEDLEWYHVTAEDPQDLVEYLHISGPELNHDINMKKGLLSERTRFWSKLPLHETEKVLIKDEL